MSKCETCGKKQYGYLCDGCIHDPSATDKYEPMTNADRIRAMSDEELAWELLTWRIEAAAKYHGVSSDYPNTKGAILEWLKQTAEGDVNNG